MVQSKIDKHAINAILLRLKNYIFNPEAHAVSLDVDKIFPDNDLEKTNASASGGGELPDKGGATENFGSGKNKSLEKPLIVRKDESREDSYIIIEGEDILRGLKKEKRKKVKCLVIRDYPDEYEIIKLGEKLMGELLPVEKILIFTEVQKKLMAMDKSFGKNRCAAIVLGVSETYLSEVLQAGRTDDYILSEAHKSGLWSFAKLLTLAKINDPAKRLAKFEEFKKIIEDRKRRLKSRMETMEKIRMKLDAESAEKIQKHLEWVTRALDKMDLDIEDPEKRRKLKNILETIVDKMSFID
ncbi:MAG: hypothetical protein LBR53_01615 [Deltaproteobacteria bacterium]|nr:hypothetical protein [Deltaproteobacteria bacterium]